MRGEDRRSGSLFSYVDLEARVAADHPLRPIRALVDDALKGLSGELEGLYSNLGRPSIAPERLLRALLGRVPGCGVAVGRPGSPWRVGPLLFMRPRRAA
jgi:hypothetical protein